MGKRLLTFTVSLPDDVARKLKKEINLSMFALEAIREKVEREEELEKISELEERLKADGEEDSSGDWGPVLREEL